MGDVDLLITLKKREGIAVYCIDNNLQGSKINLRILKFVNLRKK